MTDRQIEEIREDHQALEMEEARLEEIKRNEVAEVEDIYA